ncbi:uncharacterized protein LOC128241742 [Mya arenaria]|uniref:uncharacterized protein LOC128241742 n=1 Tax=Mya arenaria TaxID=6604 RepID=UPI0022E8802F|nr:uncharacterized protein LOC128241742 [Mya arenaria]
MISVFTVGEEEPKYDKGNHNIMLAILLGIFMCITIVITVSVFVFCRKKNSVFMLQKCEQEDSDLELNDINTEPESSTDSEYEYIESSSPVKTETAKMRSSSSPNLNQHASDNNHNGEESLRAVKNETMKSKGSNKKTSLKKAKYKSDVPASQNDNSAAPLLNAKNTEGNKKSSRSSQTVRKLTCQSRSMPIIYENPQNKTDMSSFSVVNEMRDSSQNVNFQNNEQEVSIHNKRSQKKSKHSRKHIYTRVELHAPYIDGASEVVSDIQMETDLSESILGNMKFYRRNSKEEICIIPELETSPNTNCVCLPNSMRELKKLDPTHQKAIKDGSALTKESTHDTKHRDTGGIDIKYSNMGDIDTKYSNMGDIDTKYSNMGNIDTKYSNLRETDTKYSNMEDIDT